MNPWVKAAVQGAACGLTFGFVLLVGSRLFEPLPVAAQAEQESEVVKARSFQLIGPDRKGRASLGVAPDGKPVLRLSDAAGMPRAVLGLDPDGGPALSFLDAAGEVRGFLALAPDRTTYLNFRDAVGKVRADLAVGPDGAPRLRFWDAPGDPICMVP